MSKYLLRRLLFMMISLLVMSFISFILIDLPPGDYLTMLINKLRVSGERVDEARIAALEVQYGYGQPLVIRYVKWVIGIVTRGDFGSSWQWEASVLSLIKERLILLQQL